MQIRSHKKNYACDPNLLFIQSLYFLLFSCPFLALLVIALDIEHLNTYIPLLGLVNISSKGLMKQLYFPGVNPLHCSTACASTSTCTDIHTCTLT